VGQQERQLVSTTGQATLDFAGLQLLARHWCPQMLCPLQRYKRRHSWLIYLQSTAGGTAAAVLPTTRMPPTLSSKHLALATSMDQHTNAHPG